VVQPLATLPLQTFVVPVHGYALVQAKLPEIVGAALPAPGVKVRSSDV
jgi:hypothetical protein